MSDMKTFEQIKSTLAEHKEELRQKYKIMEIDIFGSYVHGVQKKQSDLDILVEFEESANLSLLDFIGIENYLSESLGINVHLVEKHTLKPRIGKQVSEEVVNI